MKYARLLLNLLTFICYSSVYAQHLLPKTKQTLDQLEQLQFRNQSTAGLDLLDTAIQSTNLSIDLAYLYAGRSSIYASMDSLLVAKRLVDLSIEHAERSKNQNALAIAYRAKAFLNNSMNMPDAVVKDALEGLRHVEHNDEDPATKYHLNYLLYGAYSRWDNDEKMETYIRQARHYAKMSDNINLQINGNNGMSSMYLARYRKESKQIFIDSSFYYLSRSFELLQQHTEKISANTLVITCINLANYYLDFSKEDLAIREQKAFGYLNLAEEKLINKEASPERWMNIFGIKSGFANQHGNLLLAEEYLLKGLSQLMSSNRQNYKLEYTANSDLGELSLKRGDIKSALTYQKRAEEMLKKSFNEQQLFNAQKLEVLYETAKKDQELMISKQREDFRRKQNYLYGGLVITLLFGLVFMFISYHFKLRYSVERERKLEKEKQDAEQYTRVQLQLQQEEQARLKAEQELLNIRRQQLEKEALANSLIIDRKNETLKQIQHKIESGEATQIKKILKEEMLVQSDFEDIKIQVQELHPDFFNRLSERAVQKLTPLDLKYCTYIYLKMTTKQIAQALHVEPQSVRMFKYRLKQKFGLRKEDNLEDFLCE